MADIIKFKRGRSTTWREKNLLLKDGEPGFELDTHKLKIGDGKTLWNDLPYIGGESGTIDLPDNVMEFLGTVDALPATAEDGEMCIYDGKLYIYDGKWTTTETSSSAQNSFNSLVDAINYITQHNCVGQIVSIFQNNKWLPYIVDVNNNLVPIQYGEDHYDILNGGNANTFN